MSVMISRDRALTPLILTRPCLSKRPGTYILFNLAPDDTSFWIRSCPSSVLRSLSCFVSSSLLLGQSAPALILPEDYNAIISACRVSFQCPCSGVGDEIKRRYANFA